MQGDCRMEDLTRFKFQSLVETHYIWAHVGYHMSCFDIICSSKEMSMLLTCNHVSHKFMLKKIKSSSFSLNLCSVIQKLQISRFFKILFFKKN